MTCSVKLRALEPEDLELIHDIENDVELWPWAGDAQPYSRYAIRQYLAEQTGDIYKDRQLRLVVTCDECPVGIVDLTDFSPHHRRAEVGIVLLHDYHRQGIGTKALQLLSAYATERLHLRSLYAYVALDNAPAQALFRQNEYSEVGSLQRWIEGNQTATLFQLIL